MPVKCLSDDSRRSRQSSSSSSTVYVTDSEFEASRGRESSSSGSELDEKSKFRIQKRKSPLADSVTSSDSSDEDAPLRPRQNKKVSEKIEKKSFESSRSLVMHNHSLPNVNPGLDTNSIFSCILFVKTHWPLIGETLFSSVPHSNSLVSVSDPRRAFWADTAPFSGH